MSIQKFIPVYFCIIIMMLAATACQAKDVVDPEKVAVVVALTQTAAAMNVPPAPVQTESSPSGDYQPINEGNCSELNTALSQHTGLVSVMTSPEPFNDHPNQKTGFGCKVSVTTDGVGDNRTRLEGIGPAVFEADGWVEDSLYAAGGIGGSVSAYRKGNQLCLTASYVEPAEKALCGENEGFLNCLNRLAPEQIRYGYDLNCAQQIP